ncbi:hypothetical protein ACK3SF_00690 [Candidatus Nanosalina sp. VS9-1]|uniref:hypothetical protein n=1 Tax=Candidatus Nanosalina sp. VS9-1 TaxID=3388566 RepID=UPI0039DFD895
MEQYDEEIYQEFSELITDSYELLLDFQAYAEEAREADESSYREKAIVEAFSYALELREKKSEWEKLLEAVPVQGLDSVEDLMLKTENYHDRLQLWDLDLEGEPDETELAAINAVKDNYDVLEEYEFLSFSDHKLETDFGAVDLKITV